MNKQIEIEYAFGYVYDKSKLVVMYPVGSNIMNIEDYEMEVEVAFLEDGIEEAFEESDIKEADEFIKPLQNFIMKPSKIIPFVTSIKDFETKQEMTKLLKEFDEEYDVKENYIKKGYDIQDVYYVFENITKYVPKENLETLNILKIEKDKFNMEEFLKVTKGNLDEEINIELIPISMSRNSIANRLFVKNDDKKDGIYVPFAVNKMGSLEKLLCANSKDIEGEGIDLGDLEIDNTKDAGYLIEDIDGNYTFKIANYKNEVETNRQICQIVDYAGILKPEMISFINSFIG